MSRNTEPNRSSDEYLASRMEAFGRALDLFSILVDEDLLDEDSVIVQPTVAVTPEERSDEVCESDVAVDLENAEAASESDVCVDEESTQEDSDSSDEVDQDSTEATSESEDVYVDEESTVEYSESDSGSDDKRGLTSDRIKRFSTFNADQKSVDGGCAICIDGVEINKLMIRLECDHFYCSECISKWFEKNTSHKQL